MRKTFRTSLLILFTVLGSCKPTTSESKKNDVLKHELNGKVKSVKDKYYKEIKLNEKNDTILYTGFRIIEFNNSGNVSFEKTGNKYNPETSKTIFEYSENKLTRKIYYSYGVLYSETYYIRDENGFLTTKKTIYIKNKSSEKVDYINNSNGKTIKQIDYDNNGKILGRKELFYNKKKELIQTISSRTNIEFYNNFKFKYDSKGNRIEEKNYSKNGKITYNWNYQYDRNNRRKMISEGYKNKINNIASFSYDEYGE